MKNGTPSYKMPEAMKKNKHSHWKNNSGLKNLLNSYEKTAHRRTKRLKPKKQTLSLKKQFWLLKTLKIHMKKWHDTVLQNAWSQKNKHSHWKTILALKTLQIHMKKRHSTVLQNAWSQKNKHSHWKNNSGLKDPINSLKKRHSTVKQNAWSQKKTYTLIEKTIRVLKTL